MHAGKLPSAPCNFAFHVYGFTSLHISKSYSPLPLLQPSSMSADLILLREGARRAPTCGWKTWTDWLVKMIPLQKAGVNSIPNTTHSQAIKQVQGRVSACVFYEMWKKKKKKKVSSKGLLPGMLTEQNLCHRFMRHFRCPYLTTRAGLFLTSSDCWVCNQHACSAAEVCLRDLHRLGCVLHGGPHSSETKKEGRIWSQDLNLPPFSTRFRRFLWRRDSTRGNPAAGDPVFIYRDDCQLHVKIIRSLQRISASLKLSFQSYLITSVWAVLKVQV